MRDGMLSTVEGLGFVIPAPNPFANHPKYNIQDSILQKGVILQVVAR